MGRVLVSLITLAGLMLPAVAMGQLAQQPTVRVRTTHIVEFDLPAPADASPGAMIVDSQGRDSNRIWFVTRLGTQRVIRLDPTKSIMKGSAKWTSWELEPSFSTGGVKRIRGSSDRRFIFVRTAESIQRIDTQSCNINGCQRTVWEDQVGSLNVSDLTVDDRNNVFTAGATDPTLPSTSYIQRLTPGPFPGDGVTSSAIVTRWFVGGGAGFCADLGKTTTSFPCLSGIAVHPSNKNLIYYSEPEGDDTFGNIGELNISTSPATIRRWHLSKVPTSDPQGGPVKQPRQLIIDSWGIVWVNTGSGHLVSLNPANNKMRAHTIPAAALSDPFGIAPDDDVVGYSDASNTKVGMLFPQGVLTFVDPAQCDPRVPAPPGCPTPTPVQKPVMGERAVMDSNAVQPNGKVVTVTETHKQDGVFVEAQLDSNANDDLSPLGITPAKWKGQGTFFYAVGANASGLVDRVGFVRLPMPQRVKHPRDDDDTDDGCCSPTQPIGWHNSDLGDDDDDGLGDEVDTPTANEKTTIGDPAPLNPGQSIDYPVTASPTTLALIAIATADNALGQITVEIYNALGALVAGSLTAPGTATSTVTLPAAGSYIVRVRNYGLSAITHTPTIVVKEPWVP